MKKLFLSASIFLILFLAAVIHRNNNLRIIIYNLTDKGGSGINELKYKIYLLGILPVGEAVFKVEGIEEYQGQKAYHLSASAFPLKLYSKFYNGYADFDSYVDTKTRNPLVFKQKISVPNKPDINREVFYDQANGIMALNGVRRQILPDTQDPLSLALNISRMDFDKIKEFEMNINTNQKNYLLKGVAQTKDLVIGDKVYKTVSLQAHIGRRDKNPYHQSSISMVLVKKKQNIPVFIKVFASGFLVTAKLIEIE